MGSYSCGAGPGSYVDISEKDDADNRAEWMDAAAIYYIS